MTKDCLPPPLPTQKKKEKKKRRSFQICKVIAIRAELRGCKLLISQIWKSLSEKLCICTAQESSRQLGWIDKLSALFTSLLV